MRCRGSAGLATQLQLRVPARGQPRPRQALRHLRRPQDGPESGRGQGRGVQHTRLQQHAGAAGHRRAKKRFCHARTSPLPHSAGRCPADSASPGPKVGGGGARGRCGEEGSTPWDGDWASAPSRRNQLLGRAANLAGSSLNVPRSPHSSARFGIRHGSGRPAHRGLPSEGERSRRCDRCARPHHRMGRHRVDLVGGRRGA